MAIFIVTGSTEDDRLSVVRSVAETLTLRIFDGNDFYTAAEAESIEQGAVLNEEQRRNWISRIVQALHQSGVPASILACADLSEQERQRIRKAVVKPSFFYHLTTDDRMLKDRGEYQSFVEKDLAAYRAGTVHQAGGVIAIDRSQTGDLVRSQIVSHIRSMKDAGVLTLPA